MAERNSGNPSRFSRWYRKRTRARTEVAGNADSDDSNRASNSENNSTDSDQSQETRRKRQRNCDKQSSPSQSGSDHDSNNSVANAEEETPSDNASEHERDETGSQGNSSSNNEEVREGEGGEEQLGELEQNANSEDDAVSQESNRSNDEEMREGEQQVEQFGELGQDAISEEDGSGAEEVREGGRGEGIQGEQNEQHDVNGQDAEEGNYSGSDESGASSDPADSDSDPDSAHDEADSDDDDDEGFPGNDEPLYNGARITFGESLLAVLSFVLSHKLTGQCLNDLLALIALHCGPNNLCLETLYKFKKYFKMIGKKMLICHYFCSVCEVSLENQNSVCGTCNGQHDTSYFIEFPIVTQLQNMYMRPGFYESLTFKWNRVKKNADNIEDVYDGMIYQSQMQRGFLADPNNISFFLYFDGVQLFKNSSFQIWPAYLSINELKYTQRTKKENIILAGLWFGKSKPNPNLFLKPFQESMLTLETEGAELNLPNANSVRVRGKVIGAVADMPAKALFMRLTQFNGAYSCFLCTAQGGRFYLGNSSVQVFPYSRNLDIRTEDETREYAEQALIARQRDPDATVYGVKGPTLLSVILPDMIKCMGIDVMHGVFLGAMRTLMTLWFDPSYSESPFSSSAFVHIVDIRLKAIKPPASYKVPRSIKKEFALMKASDFKVFFFFYSLPLLIGILPVRYWQHHCKLVTAIALLCQDSISFEQVDEAENLLHSYVSDFQEMYGLRHLSLTFHQLLHLPLLVRNLGNCWVYSCFFYESLNGEFARLVHGSRHAALQICTSSSVFMNHSVKVLSMNDSAAKTMCLKLMGRTKLKLKLTENINQKSDVVGKIKTCNPVPPHIRRLFENSYQVVGGRYKYFYRLKIKGTVYNSETYVRSTKKLSCFALVLSEEIPYLCKINHFVRWSSCAENCPLECNDCRKLYVCIVTLYERIPWEAHEAPQNVSPHWLDKVSSTNIIREFPVDAIKSVCLYMSIEGNEFIASPVNSLEVE